MRERPPRWNVHRPGSRITRQRPAVKGKQCLHGHDAEDIREQDEVMDSEGTATGLHNRLVNLREGFKSIYRTYEKFYGSLRKEGNLPYALTSRGAWAASRPVHVFHFFRILGLEQYGKFVDLGSGDGIVAHLAALFTASRGIEADASLCRMAGRLSRQLNLPHEVRFACEDFMHSHLMDADCLYIYPDKPVHPLEDRLKDWRGALLIYGPHFKPKRFTPLQTLQCGRERLVVYGR